MAVFAQQESSCGCILHHLVSTIVVSVITKLAHALNVGPTLFARKAGTRRSRTWMRGQGIDTHDADAERGVVVGLSTKGWG